MTSLAHDLRYALRLIRRRPAVAAAAMLTFALGIGANTAIFTVVNAVLFKPLPYAPSDRLMFVSIDANTGFGDRTALPVADFLAWQAANRACEKVAAFTDNEPVAVTGIGEHRRGDAGNVDRDRRRCCGRLRAAAGAARGKRRSKHCIAGRIVRG